jgi:hypothetical protein
VADIKNLAGRHQENMVTGAEVRLETRTDIFPASALFF